HRLFAQVKPDDGRDVRVERLVVGDAGADRVRDGDVSGADRVEESRHAQLGVVPARQRMDEVGVHTAVYHIGAGRTGGRSHVDNVVVDEEVAPIDQLDAHLP